MKVGRIAIWTITRYVLPFVEVEEDGVKVLFFFAVEFCTEMLFMQDSDY